MAIVEITTWWKILSNLIKEDFKVAKDSQCKEGEGTREATELFWSMHFEFHRCRRKTAVSWHLILKKEERRRKRRGKKGEKIDMRKRNGRQRMTRGKVTMTAKTTKAWERIGETRARGEYHNRWEREEME